MCLTREDEYLVDELTAREDGIDVVGCAPRASASHKARNVLSLVYVTSGVWPETEGRLPVNTQRANSAPSG